MIAANIQEEANNEWPTAEGTLGTFMMNKYEYY